MYKGCLFDSNTGKTISTINLTTVQDVIYYMHLQLLLGKKAGILDTDDKLVMKIEDGKLMHPEIAS